MKTKPPLKLKDNEPNEGEDSNEENKNTKFLL